MKNIVTRFALPFLVLPVALCAAEGSSVSGWHAQSLTQAIGYMVMFGVLGILLAIVGYKAFDRFTPGELHREIVENKNVAAAIIGGAVILGVCIIIAAAMLG